MRNLKKILALVLALVMSLSLMAVASADDELNLGDVSDVYAESVDVLTGLKVFMGNKGEFLPKDNITRAEVAAIIYRIVTGDVTNSQNGIYADYNKFSDVTSDAWYAGYVNYCANAEYVKGVGYDANGKAMFKPQQNVTGYEALAMILRAIGYDRNNEFTGPSWQIQTAATARNRGILVNIQEGTLGTAATREAVAEILCKTILVPVADYSLAFGYRTTDANGKDNETLAYKTFKMEKISGVVVANEYANLETQTTLGAEQTKLVTSVGDYTLNVASTLDDIGESRYVYVKPAAGTTRYDLVCSKVYETEGMNKTYEVTEKVDIKDAKFNTVTGMTKDAATEEYINFGPSTNWKSDWRIRYVVSLNATKSTVAPITSANDTTSINRAIAELHGKFNLSVYPGTTDAPVNGVTTVSLSNGGAYVLTWDDATNPTSIKTITYSQEFAIKDDITPTHQGNIEQIFNIADRTSLNYTSTGGYVINSDGYLVGEVYVGTTSLEDVSDKMSFNQFKTTYIVADDEDIVNGNEYGNWLKVIDNDNDNVAEYVLKVIYTFTQVTAVDANGKVTLSAKDQALDTTDAVNKLTTQTVVCADELAVGNVVYYAVIDDKAQTYVPEMVTTKFEKIDRNAKTATAVENDTIYNEGGVHNHTFNDDMEDTVAKLSGTYTYDVYLTRGGHLGVFTHNPTSTFTLLTNGWYDQQRGGVEYAALAYIDGKQVDTDVTLGGSLFIGTNGGVQNNNWNAIKALGGNQTGALTIGALNYTSINDYKRGDQVRTAVGYLSADGSLIPADRVFNNRTIRAVSLNEVPSTNGVFYGKAYYTNLGASTAYDTEDQNDYVTGKNGVELRALSNTTYYYVYPNGTGGYVVDMYNGYAAAPSVDRKVVEDIYAIATRTTRASTLAPNGVNNTAYYTANVVVVELSGEYKQKGEQIFIYDMPEVHNTIGVETVKYISSTGEDLTAEVDLNASSIRNYLSAYGKLQPGLYYKYPTTRENIFTIAPMTQQDIAANNYAVGQSVTENAIGWNDWVDLEQWSNTDARAITKTVKQYNLGGSSTNSKIYGLSYSTYSPNSNTDGKLFSYSATLSTCTEGGFLNEYLGERDNAPASMTLANYPATTFEHTPYDAHNCTNYWNQNDLLIHYGSNGRIIYAISFENFATDRTSPKGVNYAQDVWTSLIPNGTTAAHTVTFYGVGDRTSADGTPVTDTNANALTIDLTWGTVENVTDPQIVVTPGTKAITSVSVWSASDGSKDTMNANAKKDVYGVWTIPVTKNTTANSATTYLIDIVVDGVNTRYTLIQHGPNTAFGDLRSIDTTGNITVNKNGDINVKDPEHTSTEKLQESLKSTLGYDVELVAHSLENKPVTVSKDTFVNNIMTPVQIRFVAPDGSKSGLISCVLDKKTAGQLGESKLNLTGPAKAYSDENFTLEIPNGAIIPTGTPVYFRGEGKGNFVLNTVDMGQQVDAQTYDGTNTTTWMTVDYANVNGAADSDGYKTFVATYTKETVVVGKASFTPHTGVNVAVAMNGTNVTITYPQAGTLPNISTWTDSNVESNMKAIVDVTIESGRPELGGTNGSRNTRFWMVDGKVVYDVRNTGDNGWTRYTFSFVKSDKAATAQITALTVDNVEYTVEPNGLTVTVPYSVKTFTADNLTVTAGAKVEILDASGNVIKTASLSTGVNQVPIRVTGPDGITVNSYYLAVTVKAD